MAEDIVKGFVPVDGCRVCTHEIINCGGHTHCSSLGFELICNCEECGGTGKPKLKPEHKYVWHSLCSIHQYVDSQCPTCHIGSWIDEQDPEVIADRQLYKDDPELWIDKHNPCSCQTCSGYCACKIDDHHKWEKLNG